MMDNAPESARKAMNKQLKAPSGNRRGCLRYLNKTVKVVPVSSEEVTVSFASSC